MTKKHLGVVAIILVLVLSMMALVACNSYKWESIGGGDATAAAISNGGYVVQQGKYIYFINGYVGTVEDNTWGKALKQGIVRAELNADGSVNSDTLKVVVPKSIYDTSKNGGIAIFGDWIYYATINLDKDKTGTPSTTDTDFMRTKIDGSMTQLIGTIASRSAEYIFTPSRVLYYLDSKIKYIDFSAMKTNKNIDNGKGAVSGTLAENVTSIVWDYNKAYVKGQGAKVSDYLFYTQSITGDDSYKNYNNMYAVRYDGTDSKMIATETSYLTDGASAENNPQNVFKFTLIDSYLEDDGETTTIYYKKTHSVNSTDVVDGIFCNKFTINGGFNVDKEKQLNSLASSTTMYPLGYEEGALIYNKDNVYCWYNGSNAADPTIVSATSQTVWYAKDGYAYLTSSSSATELYKIKYNKKSNMQTVFSGEKIKTDWLTLEFIGSQFYFSATDDYSYLHYINIDTFDYTVKDAASTLLGIFTEEDTTAKKEVKE